jgi:hypothetical protein
MHAHSFPISTAVRRPHAQDHYCETRSESHPAITESPLGLLLQMCRDLEIFSSDWHNAFW